jgi:hypothetical protein
MLRLVVTQFSFAKSYTKTLNHLIRFNSNTSLENEKAVSSLFRCSVNDPV